MSYWRAKFPNDYDEYEITFASKRKEKTKIVEDVCKAIIDKKVNSIEDISIGNTSPQWIPVTERLPEKHTIVLCYKDGQRRLGYYIGAEYGKGVAAFRHPKDQFSFGVTHWMPLPEPPEMDRGNNED